MRFSLLHPLAAKHLAKPFTNAFQEHVFSLGTWFDTALNQSLHHTGFEMRMLDKANHDFVSMEAARRKTSTSTGGSLSAPTDEKIIAALRAVVAGDKAIEGAEAHDNSNDTMVNEESTSFSHLLQPNDDEDDDNIQSTEAALDQEDVGEYINGMLGESQC